MANTLFVNGPSISNGGTITVPGTTLQFEGSTTLSGGGTVQMSSDAFVNESTSGLTLSNASTIEGTGQLGQNGLALTNESGGTVSANVSGGTLTLNGGGLVTNAGLLTATGGGIMTIDNNVANTSGNITASGTTGGTVNLQNAITVTGGTLNTSGNGVVNGENVTLSGVTVSTGSTFTDTDVTKLQGTITNNGTITNPNNTLQVTGGDVTLTGGGTVTMSSDAFFNESTGGLTLHNVNNLIEGSGQLGQNGLALDNQSGGTVNANVSGQTLTLNGGGAVTNAGLLTATGGGIMTIDNNVTNTGANITANGGTVNLENAITVTGGTLNTSGGGVMNGQNVTLNGVTVSTGSTLTDTDLTELRGTITNNGTITVPNNTLQVTGGDVTLTGGGTVMMSSDAFLNESTGGLTLHNVNNTIEGSGQLGQNGLALDNQSGGTVNANVSGQTLTLNGGGLVTNAGLLTATGGGIMTIQNNVTNANGNITANGGTVNLESAATITGGTLNTTGGGVMNGQNVTLNGVTLSTGSTLTDTDLTQLEGTITNNGTITVPNNTLQVTGISGSTVTLTGGGTVQMSSDAFFNQSTGGLTLSNVNNTIEGTGQLGQNGLAIVNQSGGTILANVPGGTLSLNGGGDVTNNGTMQVNAGSTMVVTSPLTNFSGGTLAGGTYIVNGSTGNTGTMQLSSIGNSVAGEIVDNAANIVLNGPTANTLLVDAGGNDALKPLVANTTASSSLTLEGGYSFTTVSDFSNAGTVKILADSSLKVGPSGANAYSQSSGLTKVNGTLTAASVSLTGGTLNGTGSVSGNVFNTGGTVMPGDPPGDLTFDNNYTQGIGGSLDILLGGAVGGTEYSQLLVHQQATLAGTLDLTTVDGFTLTNGDTFDILGTGEGLTNGMTALSFDGTACAPDGTNMYKCTFGSFFDIFTEVTLDPGVLVPGSSPMDLVLNVTVGSVTPGIPEPSTWAMMAIGFAGLGFAGYRKAQRRSVFDA
jgi:fibronectin-binding autotransporter adhesin